MINRLILFGVLVVLSMLSCPHTPNQSSQGGEVMTAAKQNLEKKDNLDDLMKDKERFIGLEDWEKALSTINAILHLCLSSSDECDFSSLLEDGLSIAYKYLPKDHIEVGKIYKHQGLTFASDNKYDSSYRYFVLAKDIFQKHEDWLSITQVNYLTVVNDFYTNKYSQMEETLNETEEIIKKHQIEDNIVQDVYNALGALYYQGYADYEKGIAAGLRSLELAQSQNTTTVESYAKLATVFNNVAVNFQSKGDYSRALHYYQSAIGILEKYDFQVEHASYYANLGSCLRELGRLEEAKEYQYKALFFNKKRKEEADRHTLYVDIYRFLGKIYRDDNQLDSALLYFDTALSSAQDLDIINGIQVEKGEILFLQKKYNAALPILKTAEDSLSQELNAYNLLDAHIIYNLLAKIYTMQGKYEMAFEYLNKAQKVNNISANNEPESTYRIDLLLETLGNQALLHQAKGELEEAFEVYERAVKWTEKMRQDFTFEESKIRLNERSAKLYKDAVAVAYQLYSKTKDEKYIHRAFAITEKQKSILLLESMIDNKGKKYFGVPPDMLQREQSLKNSLAFYQQKIAEAKSQQEEDRVALYEGYKSQFGLELSNLKDSLQAFYKQYYDLEYQSSIADIEVVQQQLIQEGQAFVQYLASDSLMYVFIIENDNKHFLALPFSEKEKEQLQHFQMLLRSPQKGITMSGFKKFSNAAHNIYQLTFEAIIQELSSDVESFIVVPDGGLHYVPFDVLLKEKANFEDLDFIGLPYLVRDYQFHYGYSATLLLENQRYAQTNTVNAKCLAYAPLYENTEPIAQRGNLAALHHMTLEGAAKEVQAISKHFKGSFDFNATATKDNFKEKIEDFGILHLAMHGKPNERRPKYAHLIFSPNENEENEDNLLYHYEISNMRINAQMAVLSACETGVGKMIEGEGIASLGRGFMYAGVPSVIMSLWKMNDQTTSELMPMFYENLSNGMKKDLALRQAKIDFLDAAAMENAHPFYWAGFIAIGDTTPIKYPKTNNSWWLWVLSGGLVLGGVGILFIKRK